MGLTYPYTLTNGTTADADEAMANFNEIKNNFNFDTLDDASANAAAMQATSDPYPAGSESLATDGLGELKRLRHVIRQILGTQYWFIYPDTVTKTTTYTATVNDRVILCDTSGGAWTLTLPTAVGNDDKEFDIILTVAGNDLTIDGNGSETINGSTTRVLSVQYQYMKIFSNGVNWLIKSSNISLDKPSFSVHRNGSNQSISNATWTKIQWSTEEFDTNSNFDVATNYRFTPTVAGKYLLSVAGLLEMDDGNAGTLSIYKNGTSYKEGRLSNGSNSDDSATVTIIADANGTTDYFECYVFQSTGGAKNLLGDSKYTYFTGCRIS